VVEGRTSIMRLLHEMKAIAVHKRFIAKPCASILEIMLLDGPILGGVVPSSSIVQCLQHIHPLTSNATCSQHGTAKEDRREGLGP